jgi:hypothetical protein
MIPLSYPGVLPLMARKLDRGRRRTDEEVWRKEPDVRIAFRQCDYAANAGNGRKRRDHCNQHGRRMCRDADQAVFGVGAAVSVVRVNVDDRRGRSKHGEDDAQNGCPSLAVPRPRVNSASQN